MKKKGNYPQTRIKNPEPNENDEDWVIWAAWADRITFEEIYERTGLTEAEVIQKMRSTLKRSSFRLWRKRVHQKVSIKHRTRFKKQRQDEKNWSLDRHLLRVDSEHIQDDGFRASIFKESPQRSQLHSSRDERDESFRSDTSTPHSPPPNTKDTV